MLYILDRILFLNIINKYKYTFTLYYYINYYSECVTFCKYKNKILKPTAEEIKANPPSRSAKLRYAIRSKNNFFYPSDLINKFQKYQ